jgi:hypothetical protein
MKRETDDWPEVVPEEEAASQRGGLPTKEQLQFIRRCCQEILALLDKSPLSAEEAAEVDAATVREGFHEKHWQRTQEARALAGLSKSDAAAEQ